MPEIKRNFLQGKMNKDLDERLVPNGQYRNALNVEISTSNDSNVGSIQSILGNKYIDTYPDTAYESTFFPTNAACVGSIPDDKTNSLYWLVTGDKLTLPHYNNGQLMLEAIGGSVPPFYEKDMIVRYKDGLIEPVLVDITSVLHNTQGFTGNGENTITVQSINNVGVGMTVTGYVDDNANHKVQTMFTTTVTGLGSFVAQNVPWTGVWESHIVNIPTSNDHNPFNCEVLVSSYVNPGGNYPPTNTILVKAKPWYDIQIGSTVSGTGIPQGTLVTNVYMGPHNNDSYYFIELDQTPSVNGLHPWSTQVNFTNPPSPVSVDYLTDDIQIPGFPGHTPSTLGILPGMVIQSPDFPSGTEVVSVSEPSHAGSNESTLHLSNPPYSGSGLLDVLGNDLANTITVADTWMNQPGYNGADDNYPETDFLVFTRTPVLNFNKDRLTTGLNIVDDMLFWTDNHSEPKKINIERSVQGTNESGTQHTNLINESRDITNASNITPIEEKHITVIKKAPTNPPVLEMITEEGGEGVVPAIDPSLTFTNTNNASGLVEVGGIISNLPILVSTGEFEVNDIVLFNELTTNLTEPLPINYHIKGQLKQLSQTNPVNGAYLWEVEILWIDNNTPVTTQVDGWKAMVDTTSTEIIFKLKFPRFATRYKYEDGEYSTFSPFSEVGFVPGDFRYKPSEGFNIGMENTVTSIELSDLVPKNIPKDVVQVDILYKESNSPNIYIVDSLKQDDPKEHGTNLNVWNKKSNTLGAGGSTSGTYTITSEALYAAVPANQLLRPWDNVPRKALGQEVTANRIVYGNYLQNYDLNKVDNTEFKAEFDVALRSYAEWREKGDLKSVKTQREYQVGITYFDEYGRETPILTDKSGTIKVPKNKCDRINRLNIQPKGRPPAFATAYKYYVKENSNEYYNLAMDRFYDAEDGNIWISFYSYDRNKIDEDTWIELKKTSEGETAVLEEAKYKVLAIENEAPQFIKTIRTSLGKSIFNSTGSTAPYLWSNSASTISAPIENRQKFTISKDIADTLGWADLNEKKGLQIQLSDVDGNKTQWYEVSSVDLVPTTQQASTTNLAQQDYQITLKKPLESDVGFVKTSTSTLLAPVYIDNITLEISRDKIDDDAEFDGRFFVKIQKDSNLESYVLQASFDEKWRLTHFNTLYYFPFTMQEHHVGNSYQNLELPTDYRSLSDVGTCRDKWKLHFGDGTTTESNAVDASGVMISSPKWFIDGLAYEYTQNGVYHATDNPPVRNHPNYDAWGNLMTTTNKYNLGEPSDGGYREYSKDIGSFGNAVLDISFCGITTDTSSQVPLTEAETDWTQAFAVGVSTNSNHEAEKDMVNALTNPGQKFRFAGDTEIYTIQYAEKTQIWNYMDTELNSNWDVSGSDNEPKWGLPIRKRLRFRLHLDKAIGHGNSDYKPTDEADHENTAGIEFIDTYVEQDESKTISPTIWETEPKPTTDIDLFYEASNVIPITLDHAWNEQVLRPGSIVTTQGSGNTLDTGPGNPDVILGFLSGTHVSLTNCNNTDSLFLADNAILKFWNGNSYISASVDGDQSGSFTGLAIIKIDPDFYNGSKTLPWFNCYSFGNGVESNRIRDDYNAVIIDKGAKVSTVSPEPYKEERRKHGLIYSGLYNSNSGVNNLNQFIQAEKITKDLNPTYGSIQKLFARKVSLVAFCEDRVIRILSNKDALYNADGNMQLTSTNKVLGEAMPFEGDYGISQNPESFAKESYRAYFTDKQRGAVLRLSMDGLTPISESGMSDYFKDNLKTGDRLIGGFDDRKDEYNLTIKTQDVETTKTVSYTETVKGWVSFKSFIPENSVSLSSDYYTFKDSRLYKHHVPLRYDINTSKWVDADEKNAQNYNVFYGINSYDSSVKLLLNDSPSSIKSFKTLNYEGSQSKVNQFTTTTTQDAAGNTLVNIGDGSFYNLEVDIDPLTGLELPYISGWYVDNITTDEQEGSVKEFIDKENKWFNYILGKPKTSVDIDAEEFSFQGIGIADVSIDGNLIGCMDPDALNYRPSATTPCDDCCIENIVGCTDPLARNYNAVANTDDGSCLIEGCTDSSSFNYDPLATIDDGSCYPVILGCTDDTMFNYNNYGADPSIGNSLTGDPTVDVNTLDGSCVAIAYGCIDPLASNYNALANTDDGSCVYISLGCMSVTALNYNAHATVDDGSCTFISGCMDNGNMGQAWWDANYTSTGVVIYPGISNPGIYPLSNYNVSHTQDDGSCIYEQGCTDPSMFNYVSTAIIDDGSCVVFVYGCTDPNANNYNAAANVDDGSCTYDIHGCTDPLAANYDPTANIDDGSCIICGSININYSTNQVTHPTSQFPNSGAIFVNDIAGAEDLINNYNYTYTLVHSNGTAYTAGNSTGSGFTFTNLPSGAYTITATTLHGCIHTTVVTLYEIIVGCMDSQANNYNTNATIDDGSCVYSGCLDASSNNGITSFTHPNPGALYTNPIAATTDDGSCVYTLGCMDPTATNYNSAANQNDPNDPCLYAGCTDSGANNYDFPADATHTDDGSCEYWGCIDGTSVNSGVCYDGTGATIACTHDCAGNLTSIDTSCCVDCTTFTTGAAGWFQTSYVTLTDVTTHGGSDGQIQVGQAPGTISPFGWASLSNLTDSSGVNYGASSPNGILNSPSGEQWTGLSAGTYDFTITGSNTAYSGAYAGCAYTYSVDINEPAAPCALTISGGIFNSSTNDIESIDVSGGVGAITFVVDYPDNSVSTGSITNSTGNAFSGYPANWTAGNVDITVTDSLGCTSTITVNVPTYPCNGTLSETHVDVTTIGGSDGSISVTASSLNTGTPYGIQLTGLSSYSVWQGLPTASSVANFSNLSAGNYTATLIDSVNSNCTTSITIIITEPYDCSGSNACRNNVGYSVAFNGPTLVNAVNGVNGEAQNVRAFNGLSINNQVSYIGLPYTIAVTDFSASYSQTFTQTTSSGIDITGLADGVYYVTSTDNYGCTSGTNAFIIANTITGCTDASANNYSSSATLDDGSCTWTCGLSMNTPSYQDEDCGGDGQLLTTGVSGNNSGHSITTTITPHPNTGTGSYTNTSVSGNLSFTSAHDATYTIEVAEAGITSGGHTYGPTGCTDTTTVTIDAAVIGCSDSNANNYVAGVTCFTNLQDECCYTITTSATGDFTTTNPITDDGSLSISLNGLPGAASGNAVVSYRVTGFGNASGYFYPGTPSNGSFATLGTTTVVIGGPTTWNNINLTGLAHGTYTLQVYVNGSALTNNSCAMQSFDFTITPG